MILFLLDSMVNRDHSFIIWKEANGDQRLEKAINWLRFIVQTKELCNIEIFSQFGLAIYEQHREVTVVLVCNPIVVAIIGLLDNTHLDVFALNIIRKQLSLRLNAIFFDGEFLWVVTQDCHGVL